VDEADLLPLARAAALVYSRLHPGERARDVRTLDLLALAVSARVRIYHREPKSGALRALDEAELARGRFTRGAMRLEREGREPLRFLLVSRAEFHAALESIAADGRLGALFPGAADGGGRVLLR
jgi:hypothetical protein